MQTENGAAAMNQSSHVMVPFNILSINPTAIMFWAAAVLMPTFQMLTVCAAVIISSPANRLFWPAPNARMIPRMMGATHAKRAVALGTKNASTKPTRMPPITTRRVLAPTLDRIHSAMRLSRPVTVIAAAMNSAAATSASAVLANPPNASVRAAVVPSNWAGLATSGAMPSSNAIKAAMMTALIA